MKGRLPSWPGIQGRYAKTPNQPISSQVKKKTLKSPTPDSVPRCFFPLFVYHHRATNTHPHKRAQTPPPASVPAPRYRVLPRMRLQLSKLIYYLHHGTETGHRAGLGRAWLGYRMRLRYVMSSRD
jgi:hypothetical protein